MSWKVPTADMNTAKKMRIVEGIFSREKWLPLVARLKQIAGKMKANGIATMTPCRYFKDTRIKIHNFMKKFSGFTV